VPAARTDAFVVRPGRPDDAGGVLATLKRAGHERPATALARALASSPPARTLPGVVVAVRERPVPLIVFHGAVDEAGRARLAEIPGLLEEAGIRLRPFSWHDVHEAVHRLADDLRHRLDPDELARCALVGIPRGGLVVAGLLAYALGIPRERVGAPPDDPERPLLLVDDCALSGVRLRSELARHRRPGATRRIALAVLCSHPALRARLLTGEAQVVAFASGADLHDHGPALLGTSLAEWRETWMRRVPGRYHAAPLDLVAFPWSEPEMRFWNPVTRTVEPGWRLMPPVFPGGSGPGDALPLQIADEHPGIGRLAAEVVPVDLPGATVLVDARARRSTRLPGTAAEIWRHWMRAGLDGAVRAVAEDYAIPESRAASDLRVLLDGLAGKGLLAHGGQAPPRDHPSGVSSRSAPC
jgi:hypothetical protein